MCGREASASRLFLSNLTLDPNHLEFYKFPYPKFSAESKHGTRQPPGKSATGMFLLVGTFPVNQELGHNFRIVDRSPRTRYLYFQNSIGAGIVGGLAQSLVRRME